MSTTISINGQIEFRFSVTDWELAREIDALLKKNARSIAKPAAVSKRENGKGRASRNEGSPETKEQVLQLLKQRYSSKQFTTSEANELIKTALGVSGNTVRRSFKLGIEKETLQSDGKGRWHFLESGTTPAHPGNDPAKNAVTPLPKST